MPKEQKASILPGISLKNIETGENESMFDSVQTDYLLIFVFSTDCFSCDQASVLWNEVYDDFSDRIAIKGISKNDIPSVSDYRSRNNTRFPLFQYRDSSSTEIFTSLPQTILAEPNGNIIFSLNGIPGELKTKLYELMRKK